MARQKMATVCEQCRRCKQRCDIYDGTSCVRCHKAGTQCSRFQTTMLPTVGKRKSGETKINRDRKSTHNKNPTSRRTIPHNYLDISNMRHKTDGYKSSRALQKEQNTECDSWECGICKQDSEIDMIECVNKMCKSWCHQACVHSCKESRHMLFAPAGYLSDWPFLCPTCVDQPNGYFSREIAEYANALENIKKRIDAQEPSPHAIEDSQQNFQRYDNPVLIGGRVLDFELAREDKFRGFVKAEVDGLIARLHQSVYDYDREVLHTIERFNKGGDVYLRKPLANWMFVDASRELVTGQPWYQIPWPNIQYPVEGQRRGHHPITAALRGMLQTSDGNPLEINQNLFDLTFSQVHTGFVGWFVIDVLANEFDIYELPNMVPMRAMMAAVNEFAEARWPGKGQHSLREVQLRTWYKSQFTNSMLLDEGNLIRRMEAFLDPLTSKFEKISRWSHHRVDIIQHTLKLWAYLQSVRGKFVPIQPAIGCFYDPQEHEAYDQAGTELHPDLGMKILWVLCRGFKIIEDSVDGPRMLTVKAHVFLG